MSFAVPCITSFMIIMEKANLQHQLMMLTHTLHNLTAKSNEEANQLYNETCLKAMDYTGSDDETEYVVDAFNDGKFQAKYQQIMAQYQSKEKLLETQKIQLETRLQSLDTMEEGIDKMISDGAKDFALSNS